MPDNPQPRRFPAPWSVEEAAEAFVVVDAIDQRLSFNYFDEEERGANSSRLRKPDAFNVAWVISRLPALIRGEKALGVAPLHQGPWTATDHSTWFAIDDASGRRVCTVYVDHPDAGALTWDEARRLANGIAKLPELMSVQDSCPDTPPSSV